MTSLRVWDGTNGKVAAKEYCDQDGTGCVPASSLGGGGSSYWTQIGNDIYNNNSGGNGYVGIGTNAVTVPLQVKGSVIFGVVNSILGTMNPYSSIL